MATNLYYSIGDPDYLKVVLLSELLGIPSTAYNLVEGGGGSRLHLVLPDGTCIFSAGEVCRFLCSEGGRNGFCGSDPSHRALVDYWLAWEASELKSSVKATLCGTSTHELNVCLARLNSHLTTTGGQYLVRDSLSLADVVTWASLYVLLAPDECSVDDSKVAFHKDYPLVCRWFISLAKHDPFTSAVWKASRDQGYDAFRKFVLGNTKSSSAVSRAPDSVRTKPRQQNTKQGGESHKDIAQDPPVVTEQIPIAELKAARKVWSQGSESVQRPVKREHPILPAPDRRNILITSALPYVNNVPHLGNIIGCVLSADVFSRYCRLRGYNSLYISGTDEYGTATETKALEEGLTPQEICEKYFAIHSAIYEWFNIDFDYFGRTSTPQQTQITQDIFWRLHARGYITHDIVDQLLCQNCNLFLADRYVEGTCPMCGYEDARGDQCDKCGRLINATELKNPRCKVCSRQPIMKSSKHLFLDLSKLEPALQEWSSKASSDGIWSSNAEHITMSWLRDGLKPRCITRDLKWGTAVPLEGYTDKVFYVWFDAPIGYLSITARYTDQWERWWKNPQEVQNYEFMAKDNVPFHTVVFPCSLLGADDNYTLLNHISSTEYLNYEDGKFSKSRGVGVFGNNAKDTGIPADVYRFYLLFVRPETQDSTFSWSDFVMKNNTELLNNLGNFINRVLMFTKNNFKSTIQEIVLTDEDVEFVAKVTRELNDYLGALEKMKIRDGLRHILSISRLGNVHIQANKPWLLVKGSDQDRSRAGSLMGLSANIVCLLSVMLQPYMPAVSKEIQEQLQAPPECNVLLDRVVPFLKAGHKLGKPSPLFSKIEESTADTLKKKFAGKQEARASGDAALATDDSATLQAELDKQAALVRELKSKGNVPKEEIDAEVQKLLALKTKLGITPKAAGKKSKKSKK